MQLLVLALITAPILLVLDLTWVGLVANQYYRSQLGSLFTSHIIVWPTVLFYIIYISAIVYFVLLPGIETHSLTRVIFGALFLGLVAYGTYDLINLSLTAGWPLQMSLVDMAWGMCVTAISATGAYLIATKILGM